MLRLNSKTAFIALGLFVPAAFFARAITSAANRHYEYFPAMEKSPKLTVDAKGKPADPVNIAIVGTDSEIATAFRRTGWTKADSLSRASKIKIAESVLLNRPDSTAPVSVLFLFGRHQDVAYEQQVGISARRRHHIRLWRDKDVSFAGRPVWIGGATYDMSAGISHRGFRPTHHIAPDIDQERDGVEAALAQVGQAQRTFRVTGLGLTLNGHNAEGDRYDTDGELRVVVLPLGNATHLPPLDPGVPAIVQVKDKIWNWVHGVWGAR